MLLVIAFCSSSSHLIATAATIIVAAVAKVQIIFADLQVLERWSNDYHFNDFVY